MRAGAIGKTDCVETSRRRHISKDVGIFFVVAMIALMSGYILYFTSNVLHHYHTSQHVAASLALFSSIATLFWYVLQLLMMLSGDD